VPLVLGVDSSTQSTKVELRDADTGVIVGRGRSPHPPTAPPRSEQQPESWWLALQDAWEQAGGDRVAAISVAAQQHGMVVLDEDNEVLVPAKLWNDTESALDAQGLLERFGGPTAWVTACGSVPVPSFTVTKVVWLARCQPEAWARTARILLPHDWITYRLTGDFVTDRGDASGTGYWSPSRGAYCGDVLALVGIEEAMLPRVLGPDAVAGDWDGGAVVGAGTGDNMAAALGIGLAPGDVAISLGTSGTVFACTESPTLDASGHVAGFADATGRFLPLVCTLNCMKVAAAVSHLLDVSSEELDALALDAEPGADGLVLVPYLDGERTPNRPGASGLLTGLRSNVTRAQLARATVEGVVCGLLDAFDALVAAGVNANGRVVLLGGGARSKAFRRVFADLLQHPVVVCDEAEHVAAGACIQAAAVLHGCDIEAVQQAWMLDAGSTIDPDPNVDAAAVRGAYTAARG
jgi:xylulokinase